MKNCFDVGGVHIEKNGSPVIIAEAGLSHFGSLEKMIELVDMAVDSGCEIVKTQHYDIDDLVSKEYAPEWYARLKDRSLTNDEILQSMEYAKSRGIEFMCTAHTLEALEFLVNSKCINGIKVGSGELGNFEYLRAVCETGLPVIASTGMHGGEDIERLTGYLRSGCESGVALLHCSTKYPTKAYDSHLRRIERLNKDLSCPVGYSDHTVGLGVPIASVVYGASIIEKHITLEVNIANAQDWKVSCTKETLPLLVQSVRDAYEAVKDEGIEPAKEELEARRWATKSIYVTRDVVPGTVLTREDLVVLRPAVGIAATDLEKIIGVKTSRPLRRGQVIKSLEEL